MDVEQIKDYCKNNKIRWTQHIFRRLIERDISMMDVREAILSGEIIEEYPEDYPEPSCLILGATNDKRYIHVVCGIHSGMLWLITAYVPNPDKWTGGLRMRKEENK